jgi:hypothetical protein
MPEAVSRKVRIDKPAEGDHEGSAADGSVAGTHLNEASRRRNALGARHFTAR